MTPKLLEALNKQMNFEFYSSWFYLAASCWARRKNFFGAESWLTRQADEEREHGLKFLNYIEEISNSAELSTLPAPQSNWGNLSELFQEAKRHEENVTRSIDALFEKSREEKNFGTEAFLQEFVLEQQEEVSRLQTICEQLETVESHPCALFLFDAELGKLERNCDK